MHCTRRQAVSLVSAAALMPAPRRVSGQARPNLPAPTGPYPVGRTAYDWTDHTRSELYASEPGVPRRLHVEIWYPAAPEPGAQAAAYAPAGWEPVGEFWGFAWDRAVAHAYRDAPLPETDEPFPVVLFTANGFPVFSHTAIIEELASHGFIVVGVTNPYQVPVTVFAEGEMVEASPAFLKPFFGPFTDPVEDVLSQRETIVGVKVADLQTAMGELERLAAEDSPFVGRLDLSRVGAAGHSIGGNAALEFCRIDRRCRAAVNLDGANWTQVGRAGLQQPAMLITVDRSGEAPCQESEFYPAALCEADRRVGADGWRVVAETARPSYTVSVAGAAHLSFLDIPFLTPTPGGQIAAALAAVTIDPVRMWRITSDYLRAFFARHLNERPAALLEAGSNGYSEVTLTVNDG